MSAVITLLSRTPEKATLRLVEGSTGKRTASLVRTDANGVHEVRTTTGRFPLAAGATVTVDDWEAASYPGQQIRWDAYDTGGAAAGSYSLVTPQDYPGWAALVCPVHPDLGWELAASASAAEVIVTSHSESRDSATTFHKVIGRSDPLPVLRSLATPTGRFELSSPSLNQAQKIVRSLAMPEVFLLKQSDQKFLDLYFVATGVDLSHGDEIGIDPNTGWTERRWVVTVQFQEVARPAGDVFASAATYDGLAEHNTYASVRASSNTYQDLQIP